MSHCLQEEFHLAHEVLESPAKPESSPEQQSFEEQGAEAKDPIEHSKVHPAVEHYEVPDHCPHHFE